MHDNPNKNLETKAVIVEAIENKFNISKNNNYSSLVIDFDTPRVPIHRDFIAGVFDGDGSVNFSFKNTRRRVTTSFTVVQGIEDFNVLQDIKDYFQCGSIYILPSKAARFQVENVSDLIQFIKPFFDSVVVNTVKRSYLDSTIKAWFILNDKGIISDKNLNHVVNLVYNINLEGKARKMTKSCYLAKFISV